MSIVTPKVWFDADDASTITANAQNTVTAWRSKGSIASISATPVALTTRTFYTYSNNGFTAAARVRFSGTVGTWERIFDFGNGTNALNLVFARLGSTSNLTFASHVNEIQGILVTATGAIVQDQFANFIVRVNENTKTAQIYKDGILVASQIYTAYFADRTVNIPYIGRSHWSSDSYFNGDISALYVFDRYITDDELSIINTHMANNTATPIPIYNPIVSLNAALINSTAGTAQSAWEDFASSGSPTYQVNPPRIQFVRASSQHFVASTPVVKTGRLTQYGKNSILLPPQSSLVTTSLSLAGTTTRSVFAVARNLTEHIGVATPLPTWSNVQYIRIERTLGNNIINLSEIEVYDENGSRIPPSTITGTVSPVYINQPATFGPQFLYDNYLITNLGVASTDLSTSGFMQIDLGSPKQISKFIIRNRYNQNLDRMINTTVYVRAPDNTNILSTPINIQTGSYIFTPNGQFIGSRYQDTELFANATSVTGALTAKFADYRGLSIGPVGQTNPNVGSYIIDDLQVNVFSLINDATVGNSVRVNGTSQTLAYNQANVYTTTTAPYRMNFTTTVEANSTLQLCELLVYDTALTAAQITAIQNYLIQKWHFPIATPQPDVSQFIASTGAINYWWRFTDTTRVSSVTLALTGGPGATTASTPALNNQYTFTGLTNGATYNCTMFATGIDGQTSGQESYRIVRPGTTPSAPRTVNFTQEGTNLRVTWTAPESDGGSPIIWYALRSNDFETNPSYYKFGIEAFNQELLVPIPSRPEPYRFIFQAVNNAGYGDGVTSTQSFTF